MKALRNTRWKNRIALALALALLMIGGLSACETGGSPPDGASQTPAAHEPITISRFNNLVSEQFLEALHKVYPEINLEIVSYGGQNGSGYSQHSLEANDMTDIYLTTQPFHKELQPERLIDLSVYDFVNNYSTFMLNSLDVNGGIYLLPTGYTVAGMWYNKTILEQNGWKVPASFEELVALAPEIEAAGYQPFANAMNLDGYPFNYFFSLGNTVYFSTQDGARWKEDFPKGKAAAADNAGLKDAIAYYNEWIENGIITEEHTALKDYQANGNIVFYLCLGLTEYEYKAEDGATYTFGIMPWLSRDGTNNMLTRNVSRYFGINARLAEPGNEQKLEDALHVLEFVSSQAGQEAIMSSTNIYMPPLHDSQITADNPYQEVADVMNSGHSVQLVFVGWEDLIIPIAQDLRALIRGELAPEAIPEEFDASYAAVAAEGLGDADGFLTETLTYEQTAALCAIATGKAVDADCAMVSLNKYHGDDNYNDRGVGWYLWAGKVGREEVNMVSTDSEAIAVLTMTGAEIKAMQAAGFDLDGNGYPYEYWLSTKGGMELEDETIYRLAVGMSELPAAVQERAEVVSLPTPEAIQAYVRELGTFGASDIVWLA